MFQPQDSNRPLDFWNISNLMCPKGVGCRLPTRGVGPRHWLSLAFPGRHTPLSATPTLSCLVNGSTVCISAPGKNRSPSSQSYSKPASSVPRSSASVPLSVLPATTCSELSVLLALLSSPSTALEPHSRRLPPGWELKHVPSQIKTLR